MHNKQFIKITFHLAGQTGDIWAFDWYRPRWPWMTLNAIIAFILHFFTEFDRFSGRLYHSGWRETYTVCKILSPSSSLLLLAKTITHPAARSLCDSWASCYFQLTRVHSALELSGRCALQIYLLTYLSVIFMSFNVLLLGQTRYVGGRQTRRICQNFRCWGKGCSFICAASYSGRCYRG